MALTSSSFAGSILTEGFEYGNHDMTVPVGWTSYDQSWLCGYQDKDHNRMAHTGNWYAFTNAEESWMFMPMYISAQLKYRFTCWAISDGAYDLEVWGGNEADQGHMSQLICSFAINHDEYEKCFAEFPSLSSDFQYFGIRAVAHEGAFHLTIDDVEMDMINRYDLLITPDTFDTVLYPGSRITVEYDVENTGFEDLLVYMTPYSEFFTDITFTKDGTNGSSFSTVPNQLVHCSCSATLSPSITPGTRCWVDIMFTVSCDCLTRMATLWATAADPTDLTENKASVRMFPNPVSDMLHVCDQGLQRVEVRDLTGRKVLSVAANSDDLPLDITCLSPGVYFVTTVSEQGSTTRKIVKQ